MSLVRVATPCPICRVDGKVSLHTFPLEVPYFGSAIETTLMCEACGFRHNDFMLLSQKDPLRLTYAVRGEAALRTRVIRSNSGTIRIPEIGFAAEPSPLSESFVSNVEGVLERARAILETARRWNEAEPEKVALLDSYLASLARMREGEEPCTIIIDDPYGNSAIVAEDVERRALTEEEIASLRTGMIILDAGDAASDLAEGGDDAGGADSAGDANGSAGPNAPVR